jgi:hypothetical protein
MINSWLEWLKSQSLLVQFEQVVRHLSWLEIIDVVVISVILYYVLRLVRGT